MKVKLKKNINKVCKHWIYCFEVLLKDAFLEIVWNDG